MALMIDMWQVGRWRGFVPSSFHGKLVLKCFLQVGFQSLKEELFTFSSSSKVKTWSFLAFSYWFELRDCFTKVLGSLGAYFDTVLLFFERKTIGHCPLGFLGIILRFVFIFWYKRQFSSCFWVKFCEKGYFLDNFLL